MNAATDLWETDCGAKKNFDGLVESPNQIELQHRSLRVFPRIY